MARAWHLLSRPRGLPTLDQFALRELPDRPLEDGELRVENQWLSVDPYMRGRMNDGPSYAAPFALDAPMNGGAVGTVVESRRDGFAVGDRILHMGGWRDGGIIGAAELPTPLPTALLDAGVGPQAFLHNLGLTGATAWLGLIDVAAAKAGDVVFISAAAGAVGSAVVQLAKARGMQVIGSAGGPEKAAAVRALGADAAIDYRAGPVLPALRAALKAIGAKGIDVYFDNVGGEHLDAAFATANDFARFAICGMIADYNGGSPAPLPHLIRTIPARIRMEGFIYTDRFPARAADFYAEMGPLVASGTINMAETVHEGLEATPAAFLGLFSGANMGKMLVRL